ncbi:3-deoxy-D-manno-octulosonic-acid transferase [Malonomonas rubra DSM 5091]|uniref:3-deoxy-D-manno-octulosonic acid transferase n=1 Tax=Malonomonas rubra DSM 5091 TaxID=1122189 RepID=A0A1M6C8A6_MALRU|nr:3-deoxy-D-manno-octulosonic acid transferase [Malonomonas rubra]SHI57242.1 3-deoxy-D-manno-octulosonic-acid transferase [Malonomonas rubra DSM 5091]
MYLLYNALLVLVSLVLVPYYLLRGLRYGKSRRGIRERLGRFSPEQLEWLQGKRIFWVHAVSVGETRAAVPLLKQLKQKYPEHKILVTNVTETGHAVAKGLSEVDFCLFFPFDFSWVVRRVFQQVKPELVAIVETEIWPNFVRQANLLNIPLVLVNGRLSDRSYPRYRFFRPLLRPLLECFSAFCMQSQVDAERISQLGAETRRVENTGNLKYDHELKELTGDDLARLRQEYRLPENLPILVAGSTHAGEEKLLISLYRELLDENRELLLVVIPRHPERCREVQVLVDEQRIESRLRSALSEDQTAFASGQVLLIDTLGEVLNLYAVADLVFVGGSLVPVGGHNLLEASLLSKPVLFGRHVQNFREISEKLIRAGAGVKVNSAQELGQQVRKLFDDPIRCRAMGQAGRSLIAENTGATERTLRRISYYID